MFSFLLPAFPITRVLQEFLRIVQIFAPFLNPLNFWAIDHFKKIRKYFHRYRFIFNYIISYDDLFAKLNLNDSE